MSIQQMQGSTKCMMVLATLLTVTSLGSKCYNCCEGWNSEVDALTNELAMANITNNEAERDYRNCAKKFCGKHSQNPKAAEFCLDEAYPKDKVPFTWIPTQECGMTSNFGVTLSDYAQLSNKARDKFVRAQAKVEAKIAQKPFFCKGR